MLGNFFLSSPTSLVSVGIIEAGEGGEERASSIATVMSH